MSMSTKNNGGIASKRGIPIQNFNRRQISLDTNFHGRPTFSSEANSHPSKILSEDNFHLRTIFTWIVLI